MMGDLGGHMESFQKAPPEKLPLGSKECLTQNKGPQVTPVIKNHETAIT